MRTVLLLPLALAAAVGAAGCGTASGDAEQTAFRTPERDLTLRQAESPGVEVASPVELVRAPVQPRVTHHARHARKPVPVMARAAASAGTAAAAPEPAPDPTNAAAAAPAATAAEPPDPHALAPGQTVTVLTAGGGPSSDAPASGPEWTDRGPRGRGTTIRGGGGGGCHPRGRGGWPDGFRGLR